MNNIPRKFINSLSESNQIIAIAMIRKGTTEKILRVRFNKPRILKITRPRAKHTNNYQKIECVRIVAKMLKVNTLTTTQYDKIVGQLGYPLSSSIITSLGCWNNVLKKGGLKVIRKDREKTNIGMNELKKTGNIISTIKVMTLIQRKKYYTDSEYRKKNNKRSRESCKKRYHTDPEYREKVIERNKEYYKGKKGNK